MYLIINPRHDYKIQPDNIIPESWNNLFSIDELVIIKLPIMNFERVCISQKYIPQIYTEEIDKKTPLLKIEYCIILCDECDCWIDRKTLDKHNITDFGGWGKEESSGIQAISQEMFIHPLIKAVQELKAELDAAKARIATLEG